MELTADCARCVGLCCVALAFSKGGDFALDKPAGQPCPNLQSDNRCGVHGELTARGFPGCVSFDCFGAGQHVSQALSLGGDGALRRGPEVLAVFNRLRPLFLARWEVEHALGWCPPGRREALVNMSRSLSEMATVEIEEGPLRQALRHVGELLRGVSAAARRGRGEALSGATLIEAPFAGRDLRWADLSGALLLGADLAGADLRGADLRGADLRVARLHGADLRGALFLTPMQLSSALGDADTRLSEGLERPARWG